jgi:hypothetical protein
VAILSAFVIGTFVGVGYYAYQHSTDFSSFVSNLFSSDAWSYGLQVGAVSAGIVGIAGGLALVAAPVIFGASVFGAAATFATAATAVGGGLVAMFVGGFSLGMGLSGGNWRVGFDYGTKAFFAGLSVLSFLGGIRLTVMGFQAVGAALAFAGFESAHNGFFPDPRNQNLARMSFVERWLKSYAVTFVGTLVTVGSLSLMGGVAGATVWQAALAGWLGNGVAQLLGMKLGLQDRFDWIGFALSGPSMMLFHGLAGLLTGVFTNQVSRQVFGNLLTRYLGRTLAASGASSAAVAYFGGHFLAGFFSSLAHGLIEDQALHAMYGDRAPRRSWGDLIIHALLNAILQTAGATPNYRYELRDASPQGRTGFGDYTAADVKAALDAALDVYRTPGERRYNQPIDETDLRWLSRSNDLNGLDIRDFHDPLTNFHADLYEYTAADGTRRWILAFRGTEATSLRDWLTNLANGLGISTAQYEMAARLAGRVQELARAQGIELWLAGHSKGGGQAQFAGLEHGIPTISFNGAGLSYAQMERFLASGQLAENRGDITHINNQGDILSDRLQSMGFNVGETYWVRSGDFFGVTNHLGDALRRGLSRAIAENAQDRGYGSWTAEEMMLLAQLARASYEGKDLPPGWELVARYDTEWYGFHAVEVRNTNTEGPLQGKTVLSFRGTDNARQPVRDWYTNLMNGLGLPTMQYIETLFTARNARARLGDDLIIVGHSKGGGQAELSGIVTGSPTVTFNNAGLNFLVRTFLRLTGYLPNGEAPAGVTHVTNVNDILSFWLMTMGVNVGPRYMVNSGTAHPVQAHGMDNVIPGLQAGRVPQTYQESLGFPWMPVRLPWIPGINLFYPQRKDEEGNPNATLSDAGLAYAPSQVRTAYGIDKVPLDGTGQVMAVVVAYDDPAIYQALDVFDRRFGLTASGPSLYQLYGPSSSFLTVLNQDGQSTTLPPTDPTGAWEREAALDLEWAHAVAPGARLVLVEANSPALSDLMSAVGTAAHLPGVSVVSMSWGFRGSPSELAADRGRYDSILTTPPGHTGVTFVASTGDSATGDAQYPAVSPSVVAVGGTSLSLNSDGSYGGETSWGYYSDAVGRYLSNSGGISTYAVGLSAGGYRTTPDVSFAADPARGVWLADPFNLALSDPWETGGGTSLSAPVWAALFALANQGRVAAGKRTLGSAGTNEARQALFGLSRDDFHDVGTPNGPGIAAGLGSPVANRLVVDLSAYSEGSAPAAGAPALAQTAPPRVNGSGVSPTMAAAHLTAVAQPGAGGRAVPDVSAALLDPVATATFVLTTLPGGLRPELPTDGASDVLMAGGGDDVLIGGAGRNLTVGEELTHDRTEPGDAVTAGEPVVDSAALDALMAHDPGERASDETWAASAVTADDADDYFRGDGEGR